MTLLLYMPMLRLTQHSKGENQYLIELALEGEGLRQTANVEFEYTLTPQDQEKIRWYLEDYLDHPFDPAPAIAAGVEKRMTEIGVKLFEDIFEANRDTTRLWARLYDELQDTRVEIITGVREAASIPWELIRDPQTDIPFALRAKTFVRTYSEPTQKPKVPQNLEPPIRILLVICRPGGRDDAPFRSVAMKILKGLSEDVRKVFEINVLRPPTFEQLGKTLRKAKADGTPYHVVHFDGHGVFLDLGELFKKWKEKADEALLELLLNFDRNRFSQQALYPETARDGNHGYLCFENPQISENMRLVDGSALGKLLVETDVPVLVLNACRSAHIEAQTPGVSETSGVSSGGGNPHEQVRAFGSLAQEVMDTGLTGVVAMRYNVYVVTAAQFVADLYAALTQGHTLGEVVTFGRKQLKDQPLREIAYKPILLQDWIVPVVYEAAPIPLFPKPEKAGETPALPGGKIKITLTVAESTPERGVIDSELPKEPDVGFYGRDETLLTLERAFDTQNIVLLHAYAGSGKTTTAAEFARWYALTGGVEVVLFTTFERYLTLSQVLGKIERIFGRMLEQNGIHYLALNEEQQCHVALQIMQQVPILWIWDNVEPIAGFPTPKKDSRSFQNSGSLWNEAEQRELADFLRSCRNTRARFLLTSRRDERDWLRDLPRRIHIPKMPMRERVQLAKGIVEKHGFRLTEVEDWRPLLQFTQGNPLTITVLVGQALRDGFTTRAQIEDFVAKLRAGEAEFEDEESEGRSKSLGASLQYGFKHAFTEKENKKLALLFFFQGFVDVVVLQAMGHPEAEWSLPEVKGMTREEWINLLDRAAEVGLLTQLSGGYYHIHPALPWYFKRLFERYYEPTPDPSQEGKIPPYPPQGGNATRAFVEAMGALGNYYHKQYQYGNRDVIHVLSAEEANLLHARQLAHKYGWWRTVIGTMQGLRVLYDHTGRRSEWQRLVEEIIPDFVDPTTDGPLPGREERWNRITEYRVRLAEEAREWAKAECLQRVRVDWNRQQVADIIVIPLEALNGIQRNQIRELAVSLETLAIILREQNNAECVVPSKEAISLYQKIGDRQAEAISAFNLGHAYMLLLDLRDLAQAEAWYQRSLELRAEGDHLGRAKSLSQLGLVAHERFIEDRAAEQPEEELLRHINDALKYYHQALEFDPPDHLKDLATDHGALGNIYDDAGDLDRALFHYREAIRYFEAAGDLYWAAETRFNVALALRKAGRLEDALLYAQAALRNFQTYGDRAAAEIQQTQELIAKIKANIEKEIEH
jgi:tetratricopeptide (TPR) repeat protein